ncbi:tagaturonate reductase [Chitinophaga sp. Cy-1792]|uniref:tagaturonate reductase n=1 Tax=Chitinophaga sp. Cy-1792 TaxID=2608339 RepID=UPI001423D7E9|nr:tagaturonate reductase [Chitinophaga sp. Cy-1792]NIG55523.1 tagaturonate reductase [Chitinophaga sp. Cy-1792]
MKLSKGLLADLRLQPELQVPDAALLALPEKVLQFGTGVLLRGLPDFFIDKANKQGLFNGRVVVIKSTSKGDTGGFEKQDNLYTQCIRGIDGGRKVSEDIINASISRVLTATTQWEEVLSCATSKDMQLVISNTTEVGIAYVEESIHNNPPASYPGKLLAFLYRRYQHFNGSEESGMVIVPAELIVDNGTLLKATILQLAAYNQLPTDFITWLEQHNYFCNSLVDSIIPGAANIDTGYEDELLIMTEVYRLWAIETDSPRVKEVLSFAGADAGVVLAPDINVFRELKLRLLNGAHTLSCGLAHLAGIDTVKAAMANDSMAAYIEGVMLHEIVTAITDKHIRHDAAVRFAVAVLDRFRNPYIEHKWVSICANYTSKLKARVVPALLQYQQHTDHVPALMALGFAAHLLFMKSPAADDPFAAYYADLWTQHPAETVAEKSLSDSNVWGTNLNTAVPGLTKTVTNMLLALQREGVNAYLERVAAEIIIS